jgi:hypothetical protein
MPALQPAPHLLAGTNVVALVPAAGDLEAAAALAWDFARSAANAGIRVALVDCYVDEPQLHGAAGLPNDAGVVDVFEYGASLSRITQPQPEPNLWFLPAGTYAPDRVATMTHPGWRRVAADFAREHMILLLFLAPECLSTTPMRLDGIVGIAPGNEGAPARVPGIAFALRSGVPLMATLTGEEVAALRGPAAAAAEPAGVAPAADVAPMAGAVPATEGAAGPVWSQAKAAYASLVQRRAEARRKLRWRIAGLGAFGVVAVAAVMLIPGSQDVAKPLPELAEPVDLVPKPAAVPPAAPASVPRAVWSLPFAVELQSSTMRSAAFASGDDLEHAGIPTLISPVRIARRIWYRVYAGPVATSGSADSLMDAVRRAGLGSFGGAKAVRVPLSFAVAQAADSAAARNERARLRRAGIPSFILGRADGGYQVFAGAFAARSEATYLGSTLRSARSPGVLGPRVGRRP